MHTQREQFGLRDAGMPLHEEERPRDQNGVPRELWELRDELTTWIQKNASELKTILDRPGTRFDWIAGMGNYHRPGKVKDADIISLSTPDFKEARKREEKREAPVPGDRKTMNTSLFTSIHEILHLAEMYRLDRAGKHNELEQFRYEAEKKKWNPQATPDRPFVTLQPFYRFVYNMLEDAMVNSGANQTRFFSEHMNAKAHREVQGLYTDHFFPVYRDVGEGRGAYIKNVDPATVKDKPHFNVGKLLAFLNGGNDHDSK